MDELAGLDVSDLNESAVEEEDVECVPDDSLCCAFPLDCTYAGAWVTEFVDIQSEFYGRF